jgi:iron complex outermembrane recepter protein
MQSVSRRILTALLTALLTGATTARPLAAQPYADAAQGGSLWGTVVDAQTGNPLPATRVRVLELGRGELSHANGEFHFDRIAPGTYTVAAQRVGYAPVQMPVQVRAGDTVRVTLRLPPSAIEVAGVVVTGTGRERTAGEAYRPTSSLEGAALRRQLGSSVAATLVDEPGIAQRYNGPAAAQPVIRGLSGDRVLMLEDGQRTGDVASTASDHAVTIDPLTAERIEVVRGPAGLLYGSNALGGVINVIREEVPRTLPEGLSGMASGQVESVNAGMTAGTSVLGALGPLALRAELSGRRAGDTRTPLGTLPSTQMDGHNAALGGSWVHGSGFAGASVRDYALSYGVPGTFNGLTIPGAHEGGVTIDLRRTTGRAQAAWLRSLGPFRSVELDGTYVRFEQTELEPGGFVGTRFGQISGTGNLMVRHAHEIDELRSEGAFGFWALGRDFSVAGSSTGSRPAQQVALAGFAYEELGLGAARLELGARYDWTRITPLDTRRGGLGNVRTRDFGAVSASLAGTYEILPGWLAGVSVARAFRTPSIEELFSDGPHLADYSFNVGNPDLDSEFGLGTDVFLRVALPTFHAEGALFRNSIRNYIYYAPTGELDPRLRRFPVFQARSDDAVLVGAEGRFQWEAVPSLVLTGNTGYVRGTRADGGEPLPSIPPLQGALNARFERPGYFLGAGWHLAGEQARVPFAPDLALPVGDDAPARCFSDRGRAYLECPTAGYSYASASAGLRWTAAHRLHTLTLNVNNLADTVWRDHLSRIKEVAPQPGRNVQLLYRVNF